MRALKEMLRSNAITNVAFVAYLHSVFDFSEVNSVDNAMDAKQFWTNPY